MQRRSQSARGVLQVSFNQKKLNDLSLLKSAVFFRWTFNNSAEAKTVSERFIRTNGSTSLLTFTPTRTLEYGTLMCWSRNSVGEQRDPCIFHIIAAGNFQNYISQTFPFGFPYWSQIIFKYLKIRLMFENLLKDFFGVFHTLWAITRV